jgi:hypothetical protein
MSVANFTPDDDEPAVRNPRLRLMVEAARAEPAPVLRVDAAAVHAGWQERRAGQRRSVAVALSLAAAVVLGVGLWQLRGATDEPEVPVTANVDRPATDPEPGVSDRDVDPPVSARDEPKPDVAEPTVAPTLAATIHVSPLEPTAGTPEVLGPRRLRLPDGSWSIDSEEAEPVEVALPDGTLELRGGSVHVKIAGDVAHVEVLRDEVLRVDLRGHRTTLHATPEPATEPAGPTGPTPAALAREAEAMLAAGDRAGAIRALRRLVTRHGRSAASQGGLIDLGRLLKAAGQPDEARCAYGLFLERWPGHALAGDVTRARTALGDGPACDGLHPR